MRIEKLITDLHNLRKENAPENFEDLLNERINLLDQSNLSKSEHSFSFWKQLYNPILAPAFSIVLVALFLVFSLNNNSSQILHESVNALNEVVKSNPAAVQDNVRQNITKARSVGAVEKVDNNEQFQNIPPEEIHGKSLDGNFENTGSTNYFQATFSDQPLEIYMPPHVMEKSKDTLKNNSLNNQPK